MAELKNKTENRNATGYDSVRVRNQSKARFNKLLATANKKDFGGRVVADDLFKLMLDLVKAPDLRTLQERSLSHEDRKEELRRRHQTTWSDHAG